MNTGKVLDIIQPLDHKAQMRQSHYQIKNRSKDLMNRILDREHVYNPKTNPMEGKRAVESADPTSRNEGQRYKAIRKHDKVR